MIRKDVNDALNNLKKDSPKQPEEKHTKSKFDDMSPDELLNAIKNGKDSRPAPAVRKLKRIQQDVKKKASGQETGTPKKKRIVIGELPDYDAIEKKETETPAKEEKAEKTAKVSGEKNKPAEVPKKKPKQQASAPKEKRKGFFSRVADMMYEDDEEDSDETPEVTEDKKVSEQDGKFTVEEIEESTASTLESISEAMAVINDEVPVKEPENISKPETEKTSESSETPEKKPENTSGNKKKKKKNSGNKPAGKKPETKTESKPEEKKSDKKPDLKSEEKKPDNSGQNNKKNKKTDSGTDKKKENTEVKKDTEKKSETSGKSENDTTDSRKKSDSVADEKPVPENNGKTEKVSVTAPAKNGKNNVLGLVCIILAIVGVIAIINTCISNVGGKDKFEKAIYPAVIINIHPFDSPSELTSDQIISAAIWSVVIDNKKLSEYNEIMGAVNIPATDVEKFAVELFGEDIPELNHTTVGSAESKFYYNKEAESYNVPIKPDTFTYLPEVTSVFKRDGKYIVNVDYIEEHPEWMDKSVSKTVQFTLSKNDDGGYKINSMEVMSESSST